jgi:protein-tyrosine phosphatase
MAEGILAHKLSLAGVDAVVDSCGFESFHVGDSPDPRAVQVTRKYGIDITKHRARLFQERDFDRFDMIFVMDSGHYRNVIRKARTEKDKGKVDYILNQLAPGMNPEVMDPWYHDLAAFEKVYHQLDQACESVVINVTHPKKHGNKS